MRVAWHRATVLLALICLAACGSASRTKALESSLVALNATRDGVLELSRQHEQHIVDESGPDLKYKTKEEAHAALDEWRAKVDKVVAAVVDGYKLIATAATMDDSKSTAEALAAVKAAVHMLEGLR